MIRKCNKTIQKNYKLFKKVFANIISLSKMLFKIISAYFFEVALNFLRRTTTKELWTSILAEIEQEDHNVKKSCN